MLQPFIVAVNREIARYQGIVAHLTGDGLTALFGAPVSDETHVAHAAHAAIAIQTLAREHASNF